MDIFSVQRIGRYDDDGTGDDLRNAAAYAQRGRRIGNVDTQLQALRLSTYQVIDTFQERVSVQKTLLYVVLETQPQPYTVRNAALLYIRLPRNNVAAEDDEIDNGAPHLMLRFRLRNPTSSDAYWVRPPPLPAVPNGFRALLAAPGPVEEMDSWRMPSRMLRRPDAYAAVTGGGGVATTGYVPVVIM